MWYCNKSYYQLRIRRNTICLSSAVFLSAKRSSPTILIQSAQYTLKCKMSDELEALVIDNGSSVCKAGFASDHNPIPRWVAFQFTYVEDAQNTDSVLS